MTDERLLASVHPPGWRNPEPAPCYNLVVLGGGTAGLVAAAGGAGLGGRVALVERHRLGGDCLNYGCVPSKALIASARAAADARAAGALGVDVGAVAVDHARVMERVRAIRAGLAPHDSASRLLGFGVDVFFGEGRFTAPDCLEVEGARLRFRKAVVATGGRAAVPAVAGLEAVGYLTHETVFELERPPRRLLVMGGGPIGCELAQAFARLGCAVTLVQRGPRLLPREDEDVSAVLLEALRRDGVRVILSGQVRRAWDADGSKQAELAWEGRAETVAADAVLVAAGRAPNVAGLGLEAAGVTFDPTRGVRVDDFLRTTNPRIYAAGDVCLEDRFTHAADAAARLVLQNALFLGRKRVSRLLIPRCTYTAPEVAQVGLTEGEARRRGTTVRAFTVPLADVDRAVADGRTEGFARVLVDRRERIVGATMVGAHAGEMLGEITLAMQAGLGMAGLAGLIHPYPTRAEGWRKAADEWNRGRLTPRVLAVLRAWLRWVR